MLDLKGLLTKILVYIKNLNTNKINISSIVNNLTTTDAGYVLDARQGKSLNDNKLNKSNVANNLTTTAEGYALDARQGKALNDGKVATSAIANNVTTTSAGYVLDARQGKALNDKIDGKSSVNATLNSYCTSGSIGCYKRGNCVAIKVGVNVKQVTSRTTIATIPAGYRPMVEVYGFITGSATPYLCVETDGQLKIDPTAARGVYSLISYPAWN